MAKALTVLGLMSGTSMDGIDACLLRTDGITAGDTLARGFTPYPADVRDAIRACLGRAPDNIADNIADSTAAAAERHVTDWHIHAVKSLAPGAAIDLIGFHGQTDFHDPANAPTYQLGDGQRLADATGIPVIFDFRSNDMQNGGQGAPLLPLYHRALVVREGLQQPACVLNLGGVGNITWIHGDDVYACDTGPASALIDDLMRRKTGLAMDPGGAHALAGTPDMARVADWLAMPYFERPAPKSLDRDAFAGCTVDDLGVDDAAATLAAFTVSAVLKALTLMPAPAKQLIVAGGGRHNAALMQGLAAHMPVMNADELGWSGDYIEAEGFAFLAARSLAGLPLSLPTTTGCKVAVTGGRLVKPSSP